MRLKGLDERTAAGNLLDRGEMFGFLYSDLALERKDIIEEPDPEFLLQQFIRTASEPLFPSKKDLAIAAQSILAAVHPHHRPHARATPVASARGGTREAQSPDDRGNRPVKRRRRRGRGRGRRGEAGKGPGAQGPVA